MKANLEKFKDFLDRPNNMGLNFWETYHFSGASFCSFGAVFVGAEGNITLSILLLAMAFFLWSAGRKSVRKRRECEGLNGKDA